MIKLEFLKFIVCVFLSSDTEFMDVLFAGVGYWSGPHIQWPAGHDPDASDDDWRNAELARRLFRSANASQGEMLWTPDCSQGTFFIFA